MKSRKDWFLIAAAALFAGSPQVASTTEIAPEVRGLGHFRLFCANCHGLHGKGDGPLVPLLKIKPQDLTLLAKEAGGQFDAQRIFNAIDGRHEVAGDGERKMPIFSDNLEISTIIELVEYLKTIQQ